ncbi:MAG: hypothetical protein WA989_07660 [Henriciella sp.]|uniref:hypothetical protein n=1 Tax=Henriciella sp. TaxID=1968823 RepID=UPI003C71A6E0
MNTRPKIKRHELPDAFSDMPDGNYAAGIVEKQIGAKFAKFVTTFEELEAHMATTLAVLLGGHDHTTAGYVLRSIRNPSTKRDVMRDLLQKAAVNQNLSEEYDALLKEYGDIAVERNQLVHGRWFTLILDDDPVTKRKVFLSRSDEHGLAFLLANEVHHEDFDPWFDRLNALTKTIQTDVNEERSRRAQRAKELQQFHDDAQDPRNHSRMLRDKRRRPR